MTTDDNGDDDGDDDDFPYQVNYIMFSIPDSTNLPGLVRTTFCIYK